MSGQESHPATCEEQGGRTLRKVRVVSIVILVTLLFAFVTIANTAPPELVDMRTETAKFYPAAKGQVEGDFYTAPIHYRSISGAWKDIDVSVMDMAAIDDSDEELQRLDINPAQTNGATDFFGADSSDPIKLYKKHFGFGVLRNKFGFLAPSGSNGAFVMALSDSERIAFKPNNVKGVQGSRKRNKLEFAAPWKSTILQYSVSSSTLKENIVLSSIEAENEFSFSLKTHGLTPQLTQDGVLQFIGKDGKVRAFIPKAFMIDAKGEVSEAVTTEFRVTGHCIEMKLTADKQWLADAKRVFPVTIDPSITLPTLTGDAYIDQSSKNTAFGNTDPEALRCGVYRGLFVPDSRSWLLLKFNLSSLPINTIVHDASLRMHCYQVDYPERDHEVYAVEFSTLWGETGVTWASSGMTTEQQTDSFAEHLPTQVGLWAKTISPSLVSNLISHPNSSILLWTYYPKDWLNGYLRYFYSKDAPQSVDKLPHLAVRFSHVPAIDNPQSVFVEPDNTELKQFGFVDKLRRKFTWTSSFPMAPGVQAPAFTCAGKVMLTAGADSLTKNATVTGMNFSVELGNRAGAVELKPFTTYSSNIMAWCNTSGHSCYDSANPSTYAQIGGSFDTSLAYSDFDWTNNPLNLKASQWSWNPLVPGHVAPLAHVTPDGCTIRYSTDTEAESVVEYWEQGQPDKARQAKESSNIGGFCHEIMLSELKANGTYEYRVITYFTWDSPLLPVKSRPYTVVSAVGQFQTPYGQTASGIIYSIQPPTVSENNPPLVDAAFQWDTTNKETNGVLYLGLTSTCSDRTFTDSTIGYRHTVTVTGLTPGVQYFYKMGSKDGSSSEVSSFEVPAGGTGIEPYFSLVPWDLGTSGRLSTNTGNGNLAAVVSHFMLAGRGPAFVVGSFYNRQSSADSPLGPGWRMSFDSEMVFDTFGFATQTHFDGSQHTFVKNASGGYDSPAGEFSRLEYVDGQYRVTHRSGDEFHYSLISGKWVLTKLQDRFKNAIVVSRDPASRNIVGLRRSSSTEDEVTFHYAGGRLDYILTKVDPATGKQYKVDYNVAVFSDSNGKAQWSEMKFTLPYELGAYGTGGEVSEQHWTTYHMDWTTNNTYVTNPLGNQTRISHWADGKRVNRISTNFTSYGEQGDTRSSSFATASISFDYFFGGQTTVTDGRGNVTTLTHNGDLTVRNISKPDMSQQAFCYDNEDDPSNPLPKNYLLTKEGHTKNSTAISVYTKYSYNANGEMLQQVDDFGGADPKTANSVTTFTYSGPLSQVTSVTDPKQNASDPLTPTAQFGYDKVNSTDPDTMKVLTSVTPQSSANYTITISYDGDYQVFQKTVLNKNTAYRAALPDVTYQYKYDSSGQLETVSYIENGAPKLMGYYKRDMFGRLLYRMDTNGSVIHYEYTNHGFLSAQTRPRSANPTDEDGVDVNLLSGVNARLSQLGIAQIQPLNNAQLPKPNPYYTYDRQLTYDNIGHVLTEMNARGMTTCYEYDELGRLIKTTAPLNSIAYSHYDEAGNMDWQRTRTQTGIAITRRYYDALNREVASYDPAAVCEYETKNVFDYAGNLISEYKGFNSNGTYAGKTDYVYDNLNRCTRTNYFGSGSTLLKYAATEYDRNGNPVTVTSPVFAPSGVNNGSLTTVRAYDAANRLIDEQATNTDPTYSQYNCHNTYTYGGGRLLSEPGASYTFDAAGRMLSVESGTRKFVLDYYANGTRKSMQYGTVSGGIFSPFMAATYSYDRAYRLLSLDYRWGATGQATFGYQYTEDGKITSATETTGGATATNTYVDDEDVVLTRQPSSSPLFGGTRVFTFIYDYLGRLKSTSLPKYCDGISAKSMSWEYDEAGNRTMESFTKGSYSEPNGLTTSTTNFRFDPLTGNSLRSSDNTTTVDNADGLTRSSSSTVYNYGPLGNELSSTTSVTESVTTTYNELWRVASQVRKSGSKTTTTNYYYDAGGVELREDNKYYFYNSNGVSTITEGTATHNYIRLGLQLLASADGFYYIVNGRGDVVALVSDGTAGKAAGTVLAFYTYEPFGALRAATKDSSVYNKFKFAGGLQSATGKYVFGARLYDPGDGRWISMDTFQGSNNEPLSLNRYAYCSNDPVNFIDPSGFDRDLAYYYLGKCEILLEQVEMEAGVIVKDLGINSALGVIEMVSFDKWRDGFQKSLSDSEATRDKFIQAVNYAKQSLREYYTFITKNGITHIYLNGKQVDSGLEKWIFRFLSWDPTNEYPYTWRLRTVGKNDPRAEVFPSPV